MRKIVFGLLLLGLAVGATPIEAGIITVSGNGNTGFGGTVGTGSLTLDHNGVTLSGTFNRGGANLNDAVVLYLDTTSGVTGFTSTAGFTDNSDGLRTAISGNDVGSNQTVATFAPGFRARYAIAFDSGFGGLWELVNGGSHNFISSIGLSPTGSPGATAHTFSVNLSSLGITVPATPISFVGTYISTTAFRSNEAFGNIGAGGNPGFSGPITYSNSFSVVPEPASLMLVGLVGLANLARRRK
jgi:hypothetical protein